MTRITKDIGRYLAIADLVTDTLCLISPLLPLAGLLLVAHYFGFI